MFASVATKGSKSGGFASAYHQIGVQTGVDAASPHQLVAMLFDGFRDAIAQAKCAMAARQFEAKGRAIGRAGAIVEEGLVGALDMESGGALAENLLALYSYVSRRLVQANLHNDLAALDECLNLLEPVRSAWMAIAPGGASPAAASPARGQ
jgi:flagellar protein FliS